MTFIVMNCCRRSLQPAGCYQSSRRAPKGKIKNSSHFNLKLKVSLSQGASGTPERALSALIALQGTPGSAASGQLRGTHHLKPPSALGRKPLILVFPLSWACSCTILGFSCSPAGPVRCQPTRESGSTFRNSSAYPTYSTPENVMFMCVTNTPWPCH